MLQQKKFNMINKNDKIFRFREKITEKKITQYLHFSIDN